MSGPRPIGRSHDYRDLYLAVVDDVREWPAAIALPPPGFVLLTALDTRERSREDIRVFARRLLEQGCSYACSWGPDSIRTDVAFDLEYIDMEERGSTPLGHVMTSEHRHESLDEALWFAIFVAHPADGEALSVLVVAEQQWAEQVETRLANPEQLSEDVLREEDGAV